MRSLYGVDEIYIFLRLSWSEICLYIYIYVHTCVLVVRWYPLKCGYRTFSKPCLPEDTWDARLKKSFSKFCKIPVEVINIITGEDNY